MLCNVNSGLQVRGTGGGWHRAHRQLPGRRGRPQQGGQEELPQNPLQVRQKQVLVQSEKRFNKLRSNSPTYIFLTVKQ